MKVVAEVEVGVEVGVGVEIVVVVVVVAGLVVVEKVEDVVGKVERVDEEETWKKTRMLDDRERRAW